MRRKTKTKIQNQGNMTQTARRCRTAVETCKEKTKSYTEGHGIKKMDAVDPRDGKGTRYPRTRPGERRCRTTVYQEAYPHAPPSATKHSRGAVPYIYSLCGITATPLCTKTRYLFTFRQKIIEQLFTTELPPSKAEKKKTQPMLPQHNNIRSK